MMAWGFFIFMASFVLAQFTEAPARGHDPIRVTLGLGLILGGVLMLTSLSFHFFGSMP